MTTHRSEKNIWEHVVKNKYNSEKLFRNFRPTRLKALLDISNTGVAAHQEYRKYEPREEEELCPEFQRRLREHLKLFQYR